MKITLKVAVITALFCSTFASCTKLSNDEWLERIHRPRIEIDTIVAPPWDTISQSRAQIIYEKSVTDAMGFQKLSLTDQPLSQ